MPVEGRGPDPYRARGWPRARRLTMCLPTLTKTVQKLQTSLQTKAKAEPAFRFYALWDKVCRSDVIEEAYRHWRANGGCARYRWHLVRQDRGPGSKAVAGRIRQELRGGTYRPQPLLRVWIPKSNGGQRPLGIPPIRDRVVQMAVVLVIGPIFEADMLANQYGFRPELDAKMAVRQVLWHVSNTEGGRSSTRIYATTSRQFRTVR